MPLRATPAALRSFERSAASRRASRSPSAGARRTAPRTIGRRRSRADRPPARGRAAPRNRASSAVATSAEQRRDLRREHGEPRPGDEDRPEVVALDVGVHVGLVEHERDDEGHAREEQVARRPARGDERRERHHQRAEEPELRLGEGGELPELRRQVREGVRRANPGTARRARRTRSRPTWPARRRRAARRLRDQAAPERQLEVDEGDGPERCGRGRRARAASVARSRDRPRARTARSPARTRASTSGCPPPARTRPPRGPAGGPWRRDPRPARSRAGRPPSARATTAGSRRTRDGAGGGRRGSR